MSDYILKADEYLMNDIRRINMNGTVDENPRPKYSDGTPAYTKFVNHNVRTYDISKGEFPITTLRPIAWKSGIKEIFTIYQKPTNVISEMESMGVKWWNPWDIGDGTIGNRYGHTVNRYDLTNNLIEDIKKDPYGRRHIIDLWQYEELNSSDGLAPCAFLTIWNVRKSKNLFGLDKNIYLDMMLIQRSGDMLTASGAGCINEVQYAAFLMMIARHLGFKAGVFTHVVANEQIYDRHNEQAYELYKRASDIEETKDTAFYINKPMLIFKNNKTNFFDMTIEDIDIINYEPMKPQLKFDLGI